MGQRIVIQFSGLLVALCGLSTGAIAAEIQWKHLSSKSGDLPAPPGGSTQQTGAWSATSTATA